MVACVDRPSWGEVWSPRKPKTKCPKGAWTRLKSTRVSRSASGSHSAGIDPHGDLESQSWGLSDSLLLPGFVVWPLRIAETAFLCMALSFAKIYIWAWPECVLGSWQA